MDLFTGLVPGKKRCGLRGWLPPNPRSEKKDRCAGECDLLGAKPALTLAVPRVSPPTPPTSWARHAPCGRLGLGAFSAGGCERELTWAFVVP